MKNIRRNTIKLARQTPKKYVNSMTLNMFRKRRNKRKEL